jgi:biopolymer transport protein ExbD
MAIGLSRSPDEPFSEMNTTPLIDVMLVLFIITLPMIAQRSGLKRIGIDGND